MPAELGKQQKGVKWDAHKPVGTCAEAMLYLKNEPFLFMSFKTVLAKSNTPAGCASPMDASLQYPNSKEKL